MLADISWNIIRSPPAGITTASSERLGNYRPTSTAYLRRNRTKGKFTQYHRCTTYTIERLRNSKQIRNHVEKSNSSYAKQFVVTKQLFKQFTHERYDKSFDLCYFNEIDELFVLDYTFYWEQCHKNNKGISLRSKLFSLYKIVSKGKRIGITGADTEVFSCVNHKFREQNTVPKTILYSVLLKIEEIDRELFREREQFCLDAYLFCYYCGGIPLVDTAHLRWSLIDYKAEKIEFPYMKTGKIARPPFIPKARTIAEKYRDKCYEEYVLPIFSKLLQAEIQRMKRLSYFEQEVNKTLAKAAKLIHFKESIKFYSAVRS